MRAQRSVIVSCVTVVMIVTATASLAKTRRLATGTWGGDHIRVTIVRGSAAVEYDCANGSITGPLNVDGKGGFSWRGFHKQERGGPVKRDAPPSSQPALYTGRIVGDTMTLTVKLPNEDEEIETYTLKKGSSGNLVKCL